MIETCAYLVENNSHLFRPDFAKWLTANYHVYAEFERSANSVGIADLLTIQHAQSWK